MYKEVKVKVVRIVHELDVKNIKKCNQKAIIAKEWLISFLSDYGFKIAKKSEKHQELITEFLK